MSTTELSPTREVTLAELARAIGRWCDRTDPSLVTGADAATAAEQVAMLARRLSTKQAALAARATECHAVPGRFPSGEAWLAGLNGTSHTRAKQTLDTVKRLADCPTARAAFDAGDLSVDEADLVTAAAVVNPAAEGRLVDRALQHVHADTRSAADRARHAVFSREQERARLARMRKLRRLRELTDGDQLTWVEGHLVPEDWAAVRPVLDAYADLEFQAARRAGRRESLDAYRADGLIAALRAAGTFLRRPPPTDSGGGGGGTPNPNPNPVRLFDPPAVTSGLTESPEAQPAVGQAPPRPDPPADGHAAPPSRPRRARRSPIELRSARATGEAHAEGGRRAGRRHRAASRLRGTDRDL